MAILTLKVRLTCVISVVLLRGKTYAFTKKYTTLTNHPVISCQITVIFLPFKRFQLLDWLIFMTWFCNKKSKKTYCVSTRYRQELFYISDGRLRKFALANWIRGVLSSFRCLINLNCLDFSARKFCWLTALS